MGFQAHYERLWLQQLLSPSKCICSGSRRLQHDFLCLDCDTKGYCYCIGTEAIHLDSLLTVMMEGMRGLSRFSPGSIFVSDSKTHQVLYTFERLWMVSCRILTLCWSTPQKLAPFLIFHSDDCFHLFNYLLKRGFADVPTWSTSSNRTN